MGFGAEWMEGTAGNAMITKEEVEHISDLPWIRNNIPEGWDFRNKTEDDLAPLQFGMFQNTQNMNEYKIIYGGKVKADNAVSFLSEMGICATVKSGDEDGRIFSVMFDSSLTTR